MAWLKRGFLFLAVNFLILIMINIVLEFFGIRPYLEEGYGINYQGLMIFCLMWGMGGAFISLMLSKRIAKWTMRLQIVDLNTPDPRVRQLVQSVHNMSRAAGLPKNPEVAIYDSPEVNAFATGPSKSNSLVAVSTGLLSRMNTAEVEGVLGHEVAHIENGDMVTMTLIQGVMNAFVMFFARIAAYAVINAMRTNDQQVGIFLQFGLVILFQIVFGILGQIVVSGFSRWREYRADAGGARLAGRDKMIAALQRLSASTQLIDKDQTAVAALKISGVRSGLGAMLATHPPLEARIARLRGGV